MTRENTKGMHATIKDIPISLALNPRPSMKGNIEIVV